MPRNPSVALVFAAVAAVVAASPALAEGDAAEGKKAFRKCAACHTVDQGNRVGPNLAGIVGRPVASLEGFRYSAAMRAFAEDGPGGGKVWDEALLAEYLAAPRTLVKGTSMVFAGIRNADEMANLIAYLKDPAGAD